MIDVLMMLNILFLNLLLFILLFKYMLLILMIMEMLVLLVSVLVFLMCDFLNLGAYMIYYLIFSVCESVLGLMILILVIRFYGNELYSILDLSKFN